jgi:hypothetical protein
MNAIVRSRRANLPDSLLAGGPLGHIGRLQIAGFPLNFQSKTRAQNE